MAALTAICVLMAALVASKLQPTVSLLFVGFYAKTCPDAEAIVNRTVRMAFQSDINAPARLLRLSFHDCFVEGCDGSILIDSTANNTAEKEDPANASVGGYEIIDKAKKLIEDVCPGVVSCADIVALASRDAVHLMGGPKWAVPTGRLDGRVSKAASVRFNLPDTTFNLSQLDAFFHAKGLTVSEIVTLSGAHTIGLAHCAAFGDRFTSNNGTLVPIDPTLTAGFAQTLIQRCPQAALPSITVPLDLTTPMQFDNVYFQNLEAGKGLMHSDETLFSDPHSRNLVNILANDQDLFFENWKLSMVKLTSVGVKQKQDGEIRKHCRRIN